VIRSVKLPGPARQIEGGAQADARRGVVYIRRLGRVDSINTTTGVRTRLAHGWADEGMLLNRSSGDLYTFNAAHPRRSDEGLSIIKGATIVKHVGIAVSAGINVGGRRTDLIASPNDPNKQSHLLQYDGTTRVAKVPVCNGLRGQANGGDTLLGYNSRTGLLYVACSEYLPKHRFPFLEIFRGTTLIKTVNRHINTDYVRVDSARNLTYVVGSSRVEVLHGTHVEGIIAITVGGKFFPGFGDSGLSQRTGDFYLGTAGHGGGVTVLRGTHVLGRVAESAEEVVVNQRTGVAYVEHKAGDSRVIELLDGTQVIGALPTNAVVAVWDPVSGDVIAGASSGIVAIRGHHVAQQVGLGGQPHNIVVDPSGDRLYSTAGSTLRIMRTSS
jgi:hypothetical protein